MKKTAFLLLASALLGCHKPDSPQVVTEPGATSLTVLKVDYLTHQFEGGAVLQFSAGPAAVPPIPLTILYRPPGDFGNITLMHTPTMDTVLDGSIIWSGKGALRYPKLASAAAFPAGTAKVPPPDSAGIQGIYPEASTPHFTNSVIAQAWAGIAGLAVTQQLVANKAAKGLFLYTPSVGIGNPADWDYFWLLYR